VVPDDRLMDEALDLASQIAGFSAHGVSMTKKLLWSSLEIGSLEAAIDAENRNQLLVRLTTENLAEAIRARKQKRTPVYKD
jgi:enoyl-CoA hydratase